MTNKVYMGGMMLCLHVFCGTPVIYIGGCCVGIEHEKKKIRYVRTLKSHMGCYLKKKKVGTSLEFNKVKKVIKEHYGN